MSHMVKTSQSQHIGYKELGDAPENAPAVNFGQENVSIKPTGFI